MNRRNFIETAAITGAAALVGCPVSAATEDEVWRRVYEVEYVDMIERAARQALAESGDKWLATLDRTDGKNPILIAQYGPKCIEISHSSEGWSLVERELTPEEWEGLPDGYDIGALLFPEARHNGDIQCYRVRAYVKNGTLPEWNRSVDRVTIKGATSINVRHA